MLNVLRQRAGNVCGHTSRRDLLRVGGLRMGQVIGQSTAKAEEPAIDPIRTHDLFSTVPYVMFDCGEVRVKQGLPREVLSLVEEARPIRELA